jgi:hypothetical protein
MSETTDAFARRCVPLRVANEHGWVIETTHSLIAEWDGGLGREAVRIEWIEGAPPYPAVSHFGHGILTFTIPYLFRTPPGINLAVRGPANCPKDGICALEGVVDTDWAVATFTMNWMFTAPHRPVSFATGEPICMLVPQWRRLLELVQPRCIELADDESLMAAHDAWSSHRATFLDELRRPDSDAARRGWEGDYARGRLPDGQPGRIEHPRRRLLEFSQPPAPGAGVLEDGVADPRTGRAASPAPR